MAIILRQHEKRTFNIKSQNLLPNDVIVHTLNGQPCDAEIEFVETGKHEVKAFLQREPKIGLTWAIEVIPNYQWQIDSPLIFKTNEPLTGSLFRDGEPVTGEFAGLNVQGGNFLIDPPKEDIDYRVFAIEGSEKLAIMIKKTKGKVDFKVKGKLQVVTVVGDSKRIRVFAETRGDFRLVIDGKEVTQADAFWLQDLEVDKDAKVSVKLIEGDEVYQLTV